MIVLKQRTKMISLSPRERMFRTSRAQWRLHLLTCDRPSFQSVLIAHTISYDYCKSMSANANHRPPRPGSNAFCANHCCGFLYIGFDKGESRGSYHNTCLACPFDWIRSIARSIARLIVRLLDRLLIRSLVRSIHRSIDPSLTRLHLAMPVEPEDAALPSIFDSHASEGEEETDITVLAQETDVLAESSAHYVVNPWKR